MVERRIVRLAARGALARGRQRPDAERMIARIGWVGVDLGPCGKLKPGLRGGVDHISFRYIAVFGADAHVRALGRAMLLHRQHPARLQHARELGHVALGHAFAAGPIMESARHQNKISARIGQRKARARAEIHD